MRLLSIPPRKFVPSTCVALTLALFAAGSLTAPVSAQIGENVRNGDFSAGTDQWFTTGNLTPTIVDGRLCVDVPGGTVEPVGRDRRAERHRPRPRRELHLLVRALVERRQQERASTRRAGGRPVRRLLHRQRTAHDHDLVVEQHVRAVDVDRSRPGRVPDRRLARPLDVLRRQRLPRRRWRERPQR